ncbi:MAG: DUF2059 domain-containing protein [Pseudomonadota bacterium]
MTRSNHLLARLSSQAIVGAKALALCLALAVPFAPAGVAQAQEFEAEHVRLAARYAELSGANQIYITVLNAQRRDIIRTIVSTNPDVGETVTEVTDAAYLEMADTTGPLFEGIAQVYAGYYSQAELETIVGFFESDAGQRFLSTRREADQQAFEASVAWGDQISVDFLARVRELLGERGIQF